MNSNNNKLKISCPSFGKDGQIPKRHTGFAEDISPSFKIDGLTQQIRSLAIIMDDLDIPFIREYNHWLIWNLPAEDIIPENIPYGADCQNGATQGVGYGKNRYRGPKQPPFIKKAHRYRFTIYGLDCTLNLDPSSRKTDLTKAMSGHIVKSGEITGWYKP